MAVKGYRVSAEKLDKKLQEILQDYIDDVNAAQIEVSAKVSRECAEALQGAGSFNGAKYRKSWSFGPYTVGKHLCSFIVYNEKHYRLTHLLEYGHDVKNQYGGTGKTAKAYPHIEAIEEAFVKEYENRIKEAITK